MGKWITSDEGEYPDGHYEDGDHEVRDGERHEEVVGDVLQSPFPVDGEADQDVAGCRRCDQGERHQRPPIFTAAVAHSITPLL